MKDVLKVLQKLKQGSVENIYMLHGTEHYFMEQFKQGLERTLKEKINEDIFSYDLREIPIQNVVHDAETIPFFNEHKLIYVNNPIFFKVKQEKLPLTHDLSKLEKLLTNPPSFSTIVFIAPYEKLDARKKITKLMKKHTVVNCHPIKQHEIKNWIGKLSKMYKITIQQDAVALLETEFGTNIYILKNEIEKLALYVGENGTVTEEIALQMISSSLTNNALQLVDAVLNKNLQQAIAIYKDLAKMREDPIGLIALLAFQFRTIFQVKLMKEKGIPNQHIQQQLKAHPYVIKLASERSTRFSHHTLEKIISELTNADTMIKRGQMNIDIAFEWLLYKLIYVS